MPFSKGLLLPCCHPIFFGQSGKTALRLHRLYPPGSGNETVRGDWVGFFTIHDADNARRRRGSERRNLESWSSEGFQALRNNRNFAVCFDYGNETGGAVVFFRDLRLRFERRKPVGEA